MYMQRIVGQLTEGRAKSGLIIIIKRRMSCSNQRVEMTSNVSDFGSVRANSVTIDDGIRLRAARASMSFSTLRDRV